MGSTSDRTRMPERQRRSGSARDSLMPMGSPAFDPVVQARARVGQTLNGKWTLDGLLGVGGMAVVYAATHRNRKRAAIKMLHPTLSALPDMRERFLREGYVANSVGHEGVVRVDDDDVTEDGTAYIVMELLEGEAIDFRADRKGGLLDAVEVLSIADQVLDVLVSAHEAGVIHRDLKPDNLFLHKNGQLKLLDFGIARLKEVNAPDTTTRTGSLMGTPAFMAPEQARGRWNDVDARTDLWAVGAIMFTLLTGRHVHDAETANEALALAITKPAPKIGSLHPAIPGSVANVVDKALSYDKGDRYQDARSMQAAVQQAYQDVMASSRMHVKSSVRPPALSMVDVAPMLTRDSISTDSQTIASHPAASTLTSGISIVDGAHRQESSAKRRGIWWLAAAAVALLGWGAFPRSLRTRHRNQITRKRQQRRRSTSRRVRSKSHQCWRSSPLPVATHPWKLLQRAPHKRPSRHRRPKQHPRNASSVHPNRQPRRRLAPRSRRQKK